MLGDGLGVGLGPDGAGCSGGEFGVVVLFIVIGRSTSSLWSEREAGAGGAGMVVWTAVGIGEGIEVEVALGAGRSIGPTCGKSRGPWNAWFSS